MATVLLAAVGIYPTTLPNALFINTGNANGVQNCTSKLIKEVENMKKRKSYGSKTKTEQLLQAEHQMEKTNVCLQYMKQKPNAKIGQSLI